MIPVLENEMRCKSLCAGLGINVLLWPVILYNFFEIPVYSILLNLIILPLMSVVLTCGMIGSFIKMAGWIPGKWICGSADVSYGCMINAAFYNKASDGKMGGGKAG